MDKCLRCGRKLDKGKNYCSRKCAGEVFSELKGTYFSDDIKGNCARCEKTIYWRPYQPIDVKKLCMNCIQYAKS